jgi:hypothetical protein
MDSYDVTAPIYQALEIVARYFTAIGDAPADAQERALEHIIRLLNEGERRPLALANRAITKVEQIKKARAGSPLRMYDGAA